MKLVFFQTARKLKHYQYIIFHFHFQQPNVDLLNTGKKIRPIIIQFISNFKRFKNCFGKKSTVEPG